jgi:hypothetical protein
MAQDIQTQRFWEGFTERTGLKKGDKVMIGNSDTYATEFTSLEDLFNLFGLLPEEIEFTDEAKPAISNYTDTYGNIYGQHPTFKLYTYGQDEHGDVIEIEWQGVPTRKRINGLLDTITFDLGDEETGFIIIKK